MYARMISLVTSPGKRKELCAVIEKDVSPLINKQPGFVEHMTLISEQEPRLVTVVSLWRTKAEAESYRTATYPKLLVFLRPLLATEPVVTSFQCFFAQGSVQPVERENVVEISKAQRSAWIAGRE